MRVLDLRAAKSRPLQLSRAFVLQLQFADAPARVRALKRENRSPEHMAFLVACMDRPFA